MEKKCPYIGETAKPDTNICNLALKILKCDDITLYEVSQATCQKCILTNQIPHTKKINTVVADVLLESAQKIIDKGNHPCEKTAEKLLEYIKTPKLEALSVPERKGNCNCGRK